MRLAVRACVLLAALVFLADVGAPPVLEDHLEPGFCNADCPVQHPGCGAAVTPRPLASVAGRWPVQGVVATSVPEGRRPVLPSRNAPRAPPAR